MGTVVAGAVAAGTGLFSTLFGGAPAPQPPLVMESTASPWAPPDPLEPGIAAGTADPFDLQQYPDQPAYIGDAVSENLTAAKDAAAQSALDLGTMLKDGVVGFGKAIAYIPLVALEGYVQIGRLLATAHKEYTEGGPGVFWDMITPSVAWDTLSNIWGSVGKEVLPIDEFGSFFDPNASLEEKLWAVPSAVIKITAMIMVSEKLATRPVRGLSRDFTLIKSVKPPGPAAVKGAMGITGSKAAPRLAKAESGFFDTLSRANKGKLKTAWKSQLEKAASKVKRFRKAMKPGNVQGQLEAVLEVQKEPLAIDSLNAKDKRFIRSFNKQLKKLQNKAVEVTREQIAREMGVKPDQVEVFKATNPKAPGTKPKAKMDQDLTMRVTKDGKTMDVPMDKLQKTYDENFYRAAGSPKNTTPEQLGRDCRNVAVDRHSAEAFGMSPDDFHKMQLGEPTSHADTVGRTMQYKADEAFARADKLAKSGNFKDAMTERWLGQRETIKSFNNQVKTRVDYLSRQASPEKMAAINKKVASVERTISEMEKMLEKGASPVQIDDFLRSRSTTAEELTKKVADIYKGL